MTAALRQPGQLTPEENYILGHVDAANNHGSSAGFYHRDDQAHARALAGRGLLICRDGDGADRGLLLCRRPAPRAAAGGDAA